LKRRHYYYDKYLGEKVYRSRNARRPYLKRWHRKRANEKKGFMRYSSGLKWVERYNHYKPAFWRTFQPEYLKKLNPDDMLPNEYTRNQTWIALCKSWNGFLLAKREHDDDNMRHYVGQIRKLRKELGLEQGVFEGFTPEELREIDLENDEDYLREKYGTLVHIDDGSNM
jgi:hypothetical protein